MDKTVLETVCEAAEDWRSDDVKGLLGRCNFKADMLDRKVSLLSGGEKARLAFCKFMVTPSNVLVLDEPTNHLDIPSKEMLEEAINEYQGTVIAVSHDRYFIKQIVNRVIEVEDGCLEDYAGDYNVRKSPPHFLLLFECCLIECVDILSVGAVLLGEEPGS